MNTFNNLSIGKKIELLRTAMGLNQGQFADKIGVHILTVHKLETGKKLPSSSELDTINREFSVDVNTLEINFKPCYNE